MIPDEERESRGEGRTTEWRGGRRGSRPDARAIKATGGNVTNAVNLSKHPRGHNITSEIYCGACGAFTQIRWGEMDREEV